ncbi:hypothetical protein [Xanthobacter sediminis]
MLDNAILKDAASRMATLDVRRKAAALVCAARAVSDVFLLSERQMARRGTG